MTQPGGEQPAPDIPQDRAEEINAEPDRRESAMDSAPAGTGEPRWLDIQAQFVDDPRKSVQLAAEAADFAVSALVESLHQQRAAMASLAAGVPNTPGETEELREMLRSYRVFCQSLADLSQQLPQPQAMAR